MTEGSQRESEELSSVDPTLLDATVVQRAPERVWLHLGLFLVTFLSAMWSQMGLLPGQASVSEVMEAFRQPERVHYALVFALTLMTILLAHEMGHYLSALRYGVNQSLPYFIPAPTLVGTLGAVILMRSQPPNRRVLLNVAVMGPYAGLLLALPATAYGLTQSIAVPTEQLLDTPHVALGKSLLYFALEHYFASPPAPLGVEFGGAVPFAVGSYVLHPVGMAGWVGLFVTSLNLIPAAQLDGGHVAYALLGKKQHRLSWLVIILMAVLGTSLFFLGPDNANWGGSAWLVWSVLLFIVGLRHPPVRDESVRLSPGHRVSGWLAMVLFVVTFVPVPITLVGWDTPEQDEATAQPVWEFPWQAPGDETQEDWEPPQPPVENPEEFRL